MGRYLVPSHNQIAPPTKKEQGMKKSILIIIGLIGLIVFREAKFAQRQHNWTMHEQEMEQQIRDLESLCNEIDFD